MTYTDEDFQKDLQNWGFPCPVGRPGNTAMLSFFFSDSGKVVGEFCIAPNRENVFTLNETECYQRMRAAEDTALSSTEHRDFYEKEADIMRFAVARIQQEMIERRHRLKAPFTPHKLLKVRNPDDVSLPPRPLPEL